MTDTRDDRCDQCAHAPGEHPMTFEEFIVAASSYSINSGERVGQSYMNALQFHRPDLYDEVMEISLDVIWQIDPFYDDKHLPKFLAFIAERW